MRKTSGHRVGGAQQGPVSLGQVSELLRENQKLIALGRLAASIAHEINNPLESITNLLYLMEQQATGETAEYLKMAQSELARVVNISKQTLTFSRETSAPVKVRLSDLIEEVLALHARRIGEKGLRVMRQYETSSPVTVFPGEMRQVFSNLISNAIEATPACGRVVVRIRPSRRWSGHGARGLRLSIGDNGLGIPEGVRNRLGQPFFTTKGQSGTGLGLWVSQSILARYGGSLQMRSSTAADRHGTVFSVFLPLNLRPLAVSPSGGATAGTSATGTDGERHWRGLRLIRQADASDSEIGKNPATSKNRSQTATPKAAQAG